MSLFCCLKCFCFWYFLRETLEFYLCSSVWKHLLSRTYDRNLFSFTVFFFSPLYGGPFRWNPVEILSYNFRTKKKKSRVMKKKPTFFSLLVCDEDLTLLPYISVLNCLVRRLADEYNVKFVEKKNRVYRSMIRFACSSPRCGFRKVLVLLTMDVFLWDRNFGDWGSATCKSCFFFFLSYHQLRLCGWMTVQCSCVIDASRMPAKR
jgi:hypothetical protein